MGAPLFGGPRAPRPRRRAGLNPPTGGPGGFSKRLLGASGFRGKEAAFSPFFPPRRPPWCGLGGAPPGPLGRDPSLWPPGARGVLGGGPKPPSPPPGFWGPAARGGPHPQTKPALKKAQTGKKGPHLSSGGRRGGPRRHELHQPGPPGGFGEAGAHPKLTAPLGKGLGGPQKRGGGPHVTLGHVCPRHRDGV